MENEIWLPIKNYEGLYAVSNYGRIMSLPERGTPGRFNEGIIRKPQKRGKYLFVKLCKNGSCTAYNIHRLVAEAFILNPNNLPVVDHIDTDCHNNCVWNLRWTSYSENSKNPLTLKHMLENRDAKGGKKASKKTYAYLDNTLVGVYHSQNEASRETGISRMNIWACINGKTKTAGGYKFSNTPL